MKNEILSFLKCILAIFVALYIFFIIFNVFTGALLSLIALFVIALKAFAFLFVIAIIGTILICIVHR